MKRIIITVSMILFFLLIACSDDDSDNPVTPEEYGKVSLAITSSSAYSINASSTEVDTEIANYRVEGIGPGGTETNYFEQNVDVSEKTDKDTTIEITTLRPGMWNISVWALNVSGERILGGSTTVQIEAGQTREASLTATMLEGTGNLAINFDWPKDTLLNPRIIYQLSKYDFNDSFEIPAENFDFDFYNAAFNHTGLANGYYSLKVIIYDVYDINGSPYEQTVWQSNEQAVPILADITTSSSFTFDEYDLMGNINIGVIVDPGTISISLSGHAEILKRGEEMTITAVTSQDINAYRWYLNGSKISEGTGSASEISITLKGDDLSLGNYSLGLFAESGSIYASEEIDFTVTLSE